MRRRAQGGQATVETVGVTVMVALLLAAVSAWLVREVRPPARAPAFIEAVATPLVRDPGPFEFRYPLPRPFEMARGRDDEPIGRALRAAGRGVREGVAFGIEINRRCTLAFGVRLGDRSLALFQDPVGGILEQPVGDLPTSEEVGRYAEELRAMPARDAALRATADACALGADVTVDVAQALLRRRIERAGRTSRQP
ncbi:MAG TPA: hypothetical protein VK951_08935 [Miltoncostaeaceae bacterium]|nr:hypothetical protein [Miltoncostaeaceae bacterium]